MRELADRDKTTIIMVTHDNKILDVADRIIIVEDGALASQEAEEAFVKRMREGGPA
jgi:putative ABC transport system ATP-binding protein